MVRTERGFGCALVTGCWRKVRKPKGPEALSAALLLAIRVIHGVFRIWWWMHALFRHTLLFSRELELALLLFMCPGVCCQQHLELAGAGSVHGAALTVTPWDLQECLSAHRLHLPDVLLHLVWDREGAWPSSWGFGGCA